MNDTSLPAHDARQWLRYSNEDLRIASQLLRVSPPSPRHTCWLCQQAAEKALKAALVAEGIDFPLTHDLDALKNLLPEGWPVRETHHDLSELTQWTVEARYPGYWFEPALADAVTAELRARSIYNAVEAEFKRRGMLI